MPCGERPLWPRRLLRPTRLRTGTWRLPAAARPSALARRPSALGAVHAFWGVKAHQSLHRMRFRLHQDNGLWCHGRLSSSAGMQPWAWWEANARLQQTILRSAGSYLSCCHFHLQLVSAPPLIRKVYQGYATSGTRGACEVGARTCSGVQQRHAIYGLECNSHPSGLWSCNGERQGMHHWRCTS